MGLFGNLFEKKECAICGAEIGMLGKKKLEDGVICKECAGKLSPFFNERRHSTIDGIRAQLDYREANKASVAAFNLTRTLGLETKVLLDEDAGKFMVTSNKQWRNANPDVMDFSQVTGCDTEVRESRSEIKHEVNGERVSYDPPRYDIDYDVYVTIHVNSPWFDDITFRVNDYRIEERSSIQFREAERQASEIREALSQVRRETRDAITAERAPKAAVICACCGATTTPDARGCCEFCGGPAVR